MILIAEILKEAETKMQSVIADAAKKGDYRTIDVARSYAVQLHEMQTSLSDAETPLTISRSAESERTYVENKSPVSDKKKKGKQSQYPKYNIENNFLTRIGWSKKEKKEYTHKASKNVYDLTVAAMEKLSKASAGPFMADKIIEKINENGQAIPIYQIYVVIGFLKDKSLLRQSGREGYNIPIDVQMQSQKIWK